MNNCRQKFWHWPGWRKFGYAQVLGLAVALPGKAALPLPSDAELGAWAGIDHFARFFFPSSLVRAG